MVADPVLGQQGSRLATLRSGPKAHTEDVQMLRHLATLLAVGIATYFILVFAVLRPVVPAPVPMHAA